MTSSKSHVPQDAEDQSLFTAFTTYMGFIVLFFFGHLRDTFGKLTGRSRFRDELLVKHVDEAPLLDPQGGAFYVRRLKHRMQDCFFRPISSRPGAWIDVMEQRVDDNGVRMETTGETKRCLNLGSYNYLGFADDWDSTCGEQVHAALKIYGPASCSAQGDAGAMSVHRELEEVVANFVGKPAAVVFNMGYNTNQLTLPAIAQAGSLLISDKLNHTSIVNGCRASGAKVMAFKHNMADDLERVVRKAIIEGRGKPGEVYRPWTKIIVVVEGIYSMEGEVCDLRAIVDVAKKYKCYTYVDEAHSIGALGKTGRGICEHAGVHPDEIDILMGTFTKSFGGMGGYIAGSQELIDYLRGASAGLLYSASLSPVVAEQVLRAFQIIQGEDGTTVGRDRLRAIKDNANYFRTKLKQMGCSVLGDDDSPIVPMMLFHSTKIAAFSREALDRDLAVVVVGAPAVPIYGGRVRFCISAAHTKEDLRMALKKISEITKVLNLRYTRSIFG
ncbi:Serine palmitoyltransferase 2 [Hondaea fermentalgiana]|uniref:serine C-palmitoyltransferase n=1 Tax=Hondaea fermentalgiana TaxID=2315210 RepID=A0A2R5GVX8_9STRA|nr:Serine palmitoyltransferase 2 [Hondaea fermentalgiana]|eukprot:GBG34996.1 Serine palmitoyltransferase 2 [Hondaea fermentalgiana]